MKRATDNFTYNKRAVLWALANQEPNFPAFLDKYQEEIAFSADLPDDLIDEVMAVVEVDPALTDAVKRYQENTQAAGTFAVPGLPEVSILIAALFILRTHIKIHKTPDGKWEFLVEHESSNNELLEKVIQMIGSFLK